MPVNTSGIYIPKRIKDATAVPSDVLKDKVFYNNDGRQIGNFDSPILKTLSISLPDSLDNAIGSTSSKFGHFNYDIYMYNSRFAISSGKNGYTDDRRSAQQILPFPSDMAVLLGIEYNSICYPFGYTPSMDSNLLYEGDLNNAYTSIILYGSSSSRDSVFITLCDGQIYFNHITN